MNNKKNLKIKYFINIYNKLDSFPTYEDYLYEFYTTINNFNIKEEKEIPIKFIFTLPNFKDKIKLQKEFLKKMEDDGYIEIIFNNKNYLKSLIKIKKVI